MIKEPKQKKELFLILHNIRSAYNIGSIFRTADAAGVSKIYLTGITPTPIDRFGRKRADIAKTALGAERTVEWEYTKDVLELLSILKKKEIYIIAVEQDKEAVAYTEIPAVFPKAFMFGNEVKGISQEVLRQCNMIAYIPMKGAKESLNVSVAVGIILFS